MCHSIDETLPKILRPHFEGQVKLNGFRALEDKTTIHIFKPEHLPIWSLSNAWSDACIEKNLFT